VDTLDKRRCDLFGNDLAGTSGRTSPDVMRGRSALRRQVFGPGRRDMGAKQGRYRRRNRSGTALSVPGTDGQCPEFDDALAGAAFFLHGGTLRALVGIFLLRRRIF
jgi:hypothetical protein